MANKTFHIIDKEELLANSDYFCPRNGCHYIDLPSGKVLAAVSFNAEWQEDRFMSVTSTRSTLPSPVFEGDVTIKKDHQDELKHLFDKDEEKHPKVLEDINTDTPVSVNKATVHDVIRRAAKLHGGMKLSVY